MHAWNLFTLKVTILFFPALGHGPVVEKYLWQFHIWILVGLDVAVGVHDVPYVWWLRGGLDAGFFVSDVRARVAHADLAMDAVQGLPLPQAECKYNVHPRNVVFSQCRAKPVYIFWVVTLFVGFGNRAAVLHGAGRRPVPWRAAVRPR